MTDENEPKVTTESVEHHDSGTALAETPEDSNGEENKEKLSQAVDISDTGPCRKHIKVTIARPDIDKRFNEKYAELVGDSRCPVFVPARRCARSSFASSRRKCRSRSRPRSCSPASNSWPRTSTSPRSARPTSIPNKLEIPDKGDFVYEFDVEVRPQFDLPNYKGLKLKKPVKTFTDADVEKEQNRILARYGQMVPKPEGNAQMGDILIADMTTNYGDRDRRHGQGNLHSHRGHGRLQGRRRRSVRRTNRSGPTPAISRSWTSR